MMKRSYDNEPETTLRQVGQAAWRIAASRWLTAVLVVLLLATPAAPVLGAGLEEETYDWKVQSLGVLRAPVGLEVFEIKDVRKALEDNKPKDKAGKVIKSGKNTGQMLDPAHPEAALELLNQLEMDGYQLTMNDGSTYHVAWMIAMRDRQDAGALGEFFQKELSPERLLQLDLARQTLNSKPDDFTFIDPKSKAGVQILEFTALEALPQASGQAYSLGFRMLVQADGFKFPLYLRLHVFNIGNQLAGAALITLDSEREFWDRIFKNMMAGI